MAEVLLGRSLYARGFCAGGGTSSGGGTRAGRGPRGGGAGGLTGPASSGPAPAPAPAP